MNRALLLLLGILASGCTADGYRRSADAQVDAILRKAEDKTLGYRPQVESPATMPTVPPKRAYAKLPLTAVPAPTTSPFGAAAIEPTFERMTGPLGPETRWIGAPLIEPDLVLIDSGGVPGRGRILGPPVPAPMAHQFDLFDCVEYAVEHSRAYKNQMDDLYLAALNVTLQRHLFELRPFAQLGYAYDGGQGNVDYRSALTASATAGVKQRLPYGGEIVVTALTQFVHALSDSVTDGESASVAISGTIPLLRGAGLTNLESLIQSERSVIYQVRTFEAYRRSFAVDVASRYFLLRNQQQAVANRERNLANLKALTDQMRALFEAGKINFLQVQQSLQAKLTAEAALLDAQDSYTAALDDFKLAIGMPVAERLDIVAFDLDVSVPRADERDSLKNAEHYRLELQTARDRVEDSQRGVQVAQNGLLPDLNVTGNAVVTNPTGAPASHLNADTLTYSAGVTLDLPVDRVAERNRYRASLIELQQSQRSYEEQREQVFNNVRDSLRAIRNAELALQIQQRGISLAERRLDFATELLRLGRKEVSARDAVEAQSALLDAQDRYDRARSQLQIRVLLYLRDTGLLRVDPKAGTLGLAMDRAAVEARNAKQSAK